MKNRNVSIQGHSTDQFTIGAKGMAKLNAVEGIKQSASSREMFAEFERRNMSPEERRRAITAKHDESAKRWARVYEALAK